MTFFNYHFSLSLISTTSTGTILAQPVMPHLFGGILCFLTMSSHFGLAGFLLVLIFFYCNLNCKHTTSSHILMFLWLLSPCSNFLYSNCTELLPDFPFPVPYYFPSCLPVSFFLLPSFFVSHTITVNQKYV